MFELHTEPSARLRRTKLAYSRAGGIEVGSVNGAHEARV
jgi:hypothetical protein